MAKPLIIGFGRAGRDLHLQCLWRAAREHARLVSAEIGVVTDREPVFSVPTTRNVKLFWSIAEARRYFDKETIVHICTPPATHLGVLREAARSGYRRLIVEKPLVSTLEEVQELHALQKKYDLEVFVVATWLASSLTARLKTLLSQQHLGVWRKMTISQLKPRFSQTLANQSHTTALEVEIPHQVALSLYLAGCDAEVLSATCSDMQVNGTTVPLMGAATITLQHTQGRSSMLYSDLTSPVRQRSVEIVFEDQRKVIGYYPSEGTDSFSQLHFFDDKNELIAKEVFFDDPLSAFLLEIYRYFEHGEGSPHSNLEFHTAVMEVLCEAKKRSGLSREPS